MHAFSEPELDLTILKQKISLFDRSNTDPSRVLAYREAIATQ